MTSRPDHVAGSRSGLPGSPTRTTAGPRSGPDPDHRIMVQRPDRATLDQTTRITTRITVRAGNTGDLRRIFGEAPTWTS